MASGTMQTRGSALNAKMQEKAGAAMEEIERNHLRPLAREHFVCAVKCYDQAGTKGPAEALENCATNCQAPYQQANVMVQNEVSQFQQRMNRNMLECQEKARDMITPGMENDPQHVGKAEDALINCMSKQVDDHVKLLKPMQDRIISSLKSLK